jgi:hypothetical protein
VPCAGDRLARDHRVVAAIVPSYLAKVHRAERHLDELQAELDRYAASMPYTVAEVKSRKGKRVSRRLKFTSLPENGLVMSRSRTAARSAPGLFAGAGLLSLFVAYVQRDGPGTTCWHTATASGCDQHLNPIPWLVVGIVLVLGAVIAQTRRAG